MVTTEPLETRLKVRSGALHVVVVVDAVALAGAGVAERDTATGVVAVVAAAVVVVVACRAPWKLRFLVVAADCM